MAVFVVRNDFPRILAEVDKTQNRICDKNEKSMKILSQTPKK